MLIDLQNHARFGQIGPVLLVSLASIALTAGSHPSSAAQDSAAAPTRTYPNVVVVNAKIWTGAKSHHSGDTDSQRKEPTALAIAGDTIAAVGTDAAIRKYVGPDTHVIDANGRRLIPGMTDSHTHLVSGGLQLVRLHLRDVSGREEFVRAVATEAAKTLPGEWVLGGRWSVESWAKPQPPNKSWIDPVTGEVPVFLSRMDGHQALVNSAALKLAGIDKDGPADPAGGEIERDPITREPTGILKESATSLVGKHVPPATFAQRYDALVRAMKHANSLGITSVHDMSSPDDPQLFRKAHYEGALTVRITSYLQTDDFEKEAPRISSQNSPMIPMLHIAGFKLYMDGSLGSRTAYMHEPYADASATTPYPRGQLTELAADTEKFQSKITLAHKEKLQLAVHAIGDEANHLLLNAYEKAMAGSARQRPLHRVEHAQHLLPNDIERFAKLGVVASMQPLHKADDGRYAEKALGKDRLSGSYAFRQLVDSGALLCFGSDWPVVSLNPFLGIDAAVNAKTLDGKVWLPSHSLTLEEALTAYTSSPARAIHQQRKLGTIEAGKLADLVILQDDPFALSQDRLATIHVATTIVAGKIVYSDGEKP